MKNKTLLIVTGLMLLFTSPILAQPKIRFSKNSVDIYVNHASLKINNLSAPSGFSWSCITDKQDFSELRYSVSYYDYRGKLINDSVFVYKNAKYENNRPTERVISGYNEDGELENITVPIFRPEDFLENLPKQTHKIMCNYWPKNTKSAIILVENITFGTMGYYAPGGA
jgi:hypothetical protein